MKQVTTTFPFTTTPGKGTSHITICNNHQRHPSLATILLLLLCGCLSFTASAIEKIYYYHNDHLGSPVAMSDQSGAVVWRADYQPFGETTTTGSIANTHGYIGKEKDPETGLYYVGARYYDPNTGRFLSVDPILSPSPQGSNRYSYALNNPYRYTDPTGLQSSEHDYSEYEFPIYIPSAEEEALVEPLLGPDDILGIAGGIGKLGLKLGTKVISSGIARSLVSAIDNEIGRLGWELFGDLRTWEIDNIQRVVDEVGEELWVVGSTLKGGRRNLDRLDLPYSRRYSTVDEAGDIHVTITKENTRSDIDYCAANVCIADLFNAKSLDLPDYGHEVIPVPYSPRLGPGIRFRPGEPPVYYPGIGNYE